jgi:hypothetical protein
VSLKIMRLFKCRAVEGVSWLAADMRLQCYTGEWAGYAVYAFVMAAVYVVGLPLALLALLFRNRNRLFGDESAQFRDTYGFIYETYGPGAWWWEVEELVRKLLLSAVVVLIDEGSPLQVTLAVLVSGWAHVLHAVYKPWGAGTAKYVLQHGSLFVTSFVFLMGLLFKVQGVGTRSPSHAAMTTLMLLFCAAFLGAWSTVVLYSVCVAVAGKHPRLAVLWRTRGRSLAGASASASGDDAPASDAPGSHVALSDAASSLPLSRAMASVTNPIFRARPRGPAGSDGSSVKVGIEDRVQHIRGRVGSIRMELSGAGGDEAAQAVLHPSK